MLLMLPLALFWLKASEKSSRTGPGEIPRDEQAFRGHVEVSAAKNDGLVAPSAVDLLTRRRDRDRVYDEVFCRAGRR